MNNDEFQIHNKRIIDNDLWFPKTMKQLGIDFQIHVLMAMVVKNLQITADTSGIEVIQKEVDQISSKKPFNYFGAKPKIQMQKNDKKSIQTKEQSCRECERAKKVGGYVVAA